MAFISKRRKDTWTVDHAGPDRSGQTNPYIIPRKDSTRSVIPTDDHAKYVCISRLSLVNSVLF